MEYRWFTMFCHFQVYSKGNRLSSLLAQSCPTLCGPKDCSMPGFPVHHQLRELAQTHVHQVGDAIHLMLCFPLLLLPSIFPMSQFFTSGGQSIGASASASVLPMNIQDWFPWGLTGLISLQSKEVNMEAAKPCSCFTSILDSPTPNSGSSHCCSQGAISLDRSTPRT